MFTGSLYCIEFAGTRRSSGHQTANAVVGTVPDIDPRKGFGHSQARVEEIEVKMAERPS
jgi:hypothetical protein